MRRSDLRQPSASFHSSAPSSGDTLSSIGSITIAADGTASAANSHNHASKTDGKRQQTSKNRAPTQHRSSTVTTRLPKLALALLSIAFAGLAQILAFHRSSTVWEPLAPLASSTATWTLAANSDDTGTTAAEKATPPTALLWWWKEEEAIRDASVTFTEWNGTAPYSWCSSNENVDDSDGANGNADISSDQNRGFFFAKTFKTGSSTAAAIHIRIAQKVANRHFAKSTHRGCDQFRFQHRFSLQRRHWLVQHQRRPKIASTDNSTGGGTNHHSSVGPSANVSSSAKSDYFVWTIVRDPAERALSAYYFYRIGVRQQNHTEEAMDDYLLRSKNYQTRHLMRDFHELAVDDGLILNSNAQVPYDVLESEQRTVQFVHDRVLSQYNFVAVVERWEESMVALQLLLDLDDGDIIAFSAKAAGGWAWDWVHGARCFEIPRRPSVLPPLVQEHLNHDFVDQNVDYLLHEAASRSLDNTIERLGKDRFERKLEQHRRLKAHMEETCKRHIHFPCSRTGFFQPDISIATCYWRDIGCGYGCVDAAIIEYGHNDTDGTRTKKRLPKYAYGHARH